MQKKVRGSSLNLACNACAHGMVWHGLTVQLGALACDTCAHGMVWHGVTVQLGAMTVQLGPL